MPSRFVILEHDHPFLHWDFLLQNTEALDSWRLLKYPTTGEWIAAEALPPHRLFYLDYEGPVSNDRGTVKQIFAGTYSRDEWSATSAAITFADGDFASAEFRCIDDKPQWRFA